MLPAVDGQSRIRYGRRWRHLFFFFQAEDGIRDGHVTGVQTCALPIFLRSSWRVRLLPLYLRLNSRYHPPNKLVSITSPYALFIVAQQFVFLAVIFRTY